MKNQSTIETETRGGSCAPVTGSAPETRSRCEIRPGIGLCDECSQPKWPQEYVGYGFMVCLDCLDTERKAQNDTLCREAGQKDDR